MNDDELPPELADLVAGLQTEIPPDRDLWEGVRAEIEPVPVGSVAPGSPAPTRSWWPVWTGLAAAAVLFALGGLASLRPAPVEVVATPPEVQAVEQWESDVRQTTDELMAVVDARRDDLGPEALEVIEAALADIDAAIADVRHALRQDPQNQDLEVALAGVYQRKVDLLRAAAELPAGG